MEEITVQGVVHNYGVELLNSSFVCYKRYWFENAIEATKFRNAKLVENGGKFDPAFVRIVYLVV